MQPDIRTTLSWLTCLVCLALCASTPVNGQYYTVQDLGVLPGATSSFGFSLNEAGQVAGQSDSFGFVWINGVMTKVSLSGSATSSASGINNQDDVVGASSVGGGKHHAFLRLATGTYDLHHQIVGTVQSSSNASDISDQGQVVGGAYGSNGYEFAFFYDPAIPGGGFNLGTLGGNSSAAYAINNHTELVGGAQNLHGKHRAFLCQWPQALTDLGSLKGASGWSLAQDINDFTQVVGWSETASGSVHAFSWSEATAMQDMGTLGGASSYANGINNLGMVVGTSEIPNGNTHAFLWAGSGALQDLNALISPASRWELLTAEAINDRSQIVGVGLHGGQQHAYLLSPIAIQSVTDKSQMILNSHQADEHNEIQQTLDVILSQILMGYQPTDRT